MGACEICAIEQLKNEKDSKNPTELILYSFEPKDFYNDALKQIATKLGCC